MSQGTLKDPPPHRDATILVGVVPGTSSGVEVGASERPLDSVPPPCPDAFGPESIGPASQREVIVPSGATVGSILSHVRRSPGDRLKVLSRVASGGMGSIDVAVDRALDRRIALKTLHAHLRGDDQTVRMFLREARLTGLLDHPHIVPVYELGEGKDGELFFAMKLVEGRTLADVIRSLPRGALDSPTFYSLLDVFTKVCDALAFAHSRGVLHCDVKPANVMVGEFGQVFLMDWGIARLWSAESSPPSGGASVADNSVIGTPGYMSPEQARGDRKTLDVRSDVFLLGALLYEILAHRPPYVSQDRNETLALAAAGVFPGPRKVAGDAAVPLELERIVLRAMAKRPEDRYPSVAALKDDILRFMRGGGDFPRLTFRAGDSIVREGEAGDAAYIIVEGRCEIRKDTSTGPVVLQSIGAGDVFGEMAILARGPRTASVVAVEPTTVLLVTSQILEQELAVLKPWMATLLKSLASRFRDIDTQVRTSSSASLAPSRIANQILMTLESWGESDGDSRTMRWSALVRELEAQVGVPSHALLGTVRHYALELDVEADTIRIPSATALRARLRAELQG